MLSDKGKNVLRCNLKKSHNFKESPQSSTFFLFLFGIKISLTGLENSLSSTAQICSNETLKSVRLILSPQQKEVPKVTQSQC